ncbi:unnamed protein product [Cylindrotheca closterium]|uniref:Uncharacterized protein n=1 Tax=Cylindrotheca closterium TaxID=2856 RepID=A0AAD2FTT5_9STRA|nr:unnamed protein product [Cylindrotheca closterium]
MVLVTKTLVSNSAQPAKNRIHPMRCGDTVSSSTKQSKNLVSITNTAWVDADLQDGGVLLVEIMVSLASKQDHKVIDKMDQQVTEASYNSSTAEHGQRSEHCSTY